MTQHPLIPLVVRSDYVVLKAMFEPRPINVKKLTKIERRLVQRQLAIIQKGQIQATVMGMACAIKYERIRDGVIVLQPEPPLWKRLLSLVGR